MGSAFSVMEMGACYLEPADQRRVSNSRAGSGEGLAIAC